MLGDKILSGESPGQNDPNLVIGSDGVPLTNTDSLRTSGKLTLTDRINAAIDAGGLETLPEDFDDDNGDWKIINSTDPFEILFLDYKHYKFISPEIVKKHYTLLEKFWKVKFELMNTGGNRIAFKNKYGESTVENALTIIKRAYEKIGSADGIERYFSELNNARLQKGEEGLRDNIEQMMRDGVADKTEIEYCLEKGIKYDLGIEEIAVIINKYILKESFKPYGTVSGNNNVEKLLSVDSWMTEARIIEAEKIKAQNALTRIQILPGKFASTIEEIGNILFYDPEEAKKIIKEDLLKPAIAQKDIVLAREIGSITNDSKDLNAAFFQIVYKLNHALPFPFINGQQAKNIKELCTMVFEDDQSLKSGKEDLKKGYIEIWLRETDKQAHAKLISIRDTAENIDQAFLAMIYSFNPALPYRFAGKFLVKNIYELSAEINKSANNWLAGKKELYDKLIITWLQTTGQHDIVKKWNNLRINFTSQDIGLEEFLHILIDKTEYAHINPSLTSIEEPGIQSGKIIQKQIDFNLANRGFAEATISFSKDIPGVSLSENKLAFNAAAGEINKSLLLAIDSTLLLKGVDYQTNIIISTSANQKIEIPVSFKVVFPKNAFTIEIVKYAAIISAFFVLIRYLISTAHADWLSSEYDYSINFQEAFVNKSNFTVFGWTFFLFLGLSATGIYFLIKYLRHGHK